MMEKLKAVGAKLEVMLHTVLDWATAQIKRMLVCYLIVKEIRK